jgi:hypothetical protein
VNQPSPSVAGEWWQDERVNLTEFLTARLDEDEAAARELLRGHPGPWRVGLPSDVRDSAGEVVVADECHWSPMPHIARHDPARVLRDVAAKRAILAECARSIECGDDGCVLAEAVIVNMAGAWGDHPDYAGAMQSA